MFDFDKIHDRKGTYSYKWQVGENELPMWVADMDFDTAPCIKKTLSDRVEKGIFGYTYIPDEWKTAYISWWKRRHDFEINPDWLIFTTGVIPALSTAVRKFTYPAEKIIVMSPVYNIFYNSIINNGRRVLENELIIENGVYTVNWTELEELLSDPLATMLILCNPQNPGGNIWSKEDLIRIADLCFKHHITVFSDEIHCDIITPGKKYTPFLSVSDRAKKIGIAAVSPTKCFNIAGLSTAAVVVCDEGIRQRMDRALNTDEVAEPNAFSVQAAISAFNDGEEWLDELNAYIYENRLYAGEFINRKIPEIEVVKSDATYLLWLNMKNYGVNGEKLGQMIREKTGLYLSAGTVYGKGGENFLRLNLACPREVLKDGLTRLCNALT